MTGDKFKFNQKGDGPARYNIIHYKQVSKGDYQWVNVGTFDDEEMELNMNGKALVMDQCHGKFTLERNVYHFTE